jgi:DnaJ-class molecular chaperone
MKFSAGQNPNVDANYEVLRSRPGGMTCESCDGRGWVYLRTYESCSDCRGNGVWRPRSRDNALRRITTA